MCPAHIGTSQGDTGYLTKHVLAYGSSRTIVYSSTLVAPCTGEFLYWGCITAFFHTFPSTSDAEHMVMGILVYHIVCNFCPHTNFMSKSTDAGKEPAAVLILLLCLQHWYVCV